MRTDVIALDAELKRRDAIKEQLLQMCPELAEDDGALIDTLDGETNVDEILVIMARSVKEREAAAKSCKELAGVYTDRAARHKTAEEALRKTIIWAMERSNKQKIKHAHVTLSWKHLDDKIEIIGDASVAPDELITEEFVRRIDKEKVAANIDLAVDAGIAVIHSDRKSVTIRA